MVDILKDIWFTKVSLWEVIFYIFIGALLGPPLNRLITRVFGKKDKPKHGHDTEE